MNSNEAISYLLGYLPWQLTNMAVIGDSFHLIFLNGESAKHIVLPKQDHYEKTKLNKIIRGMRGKP